MSRAAWPNTKAVARNAPATCAGVDHCRFAAEIGTRSEAQRVETAVKKLPKTAKEAIVAGRRPLPSR